MSFGEKIRRFLASRRRHKLWQRIVGGLGIVVVFVTTYMLILPAITMEKPTYCGHEEHSHTQECYLSCSEGESAPPEYSCGGLENYIHKHNEDCYYNGELVCPLEERENHVHTQECYTEEQHLICGQEESEGHTHDESCYSVRDELVCGMDEGEEHTHDDSCYEHIEELICGQEESEGHTHDDSCYETVRVYNCTAASAHIHDADCYDADGSLICNLEEAEEHIHSDACTTRHENKDHKHTDACYSDTPLCGMTEHKHTDACYENPDKETSGGSSSSDDKTEETTDNHKDENNDHMGYDEPVIIDDVISGAMAGPQLADLSADGPVNSVDPEAFNGSNLTVYTKSGDDWTVFDPGSDLAYAGYELTASIINAKDKVDGEIQVDGDIKTKVQTALGIPDGKYKENEFYNYNGFLVGEIYYKNTEGDKKPLPANAKVDIQLNVQGAAGERFLQVLSLDSTEAKLLTSDIDTLTGDLDPDWYDMIKKFYFLTPEDDGSLTADTKYCFVSTKIFGGYVNSINYDTDSSNGIMDGTTTYWDENSPTLVGDKLDTSHPGDDANDNNRIVRTFDNIRYNLKFDLQNRGLITPTDVEPLNIKFTLDKDISQAVFNMSDMTTWLKSWRIDYYNSTEVDKDGNPTGDLVAYETAEGKFRLYDSNYDNVKLKEGEIDKDQYTKNKMDLEYWKTDTKVEYNGKQYVKSDYNEIIRAYQKTATSTENSYDSGIRYQVLTGTTEVSLPGTVSRTTGIRVLASANNDTIEPVFNAYFGGNPLNYGSDLDSTKNDMSIFVKPETKAVALDTSTKGPKEGETGTVWVTAAPKYQFNIQSNDNLNYKANFDLSTGREVITANDNSVYGRMVGYGITLTLRNTSDGKTDEAFLQNKGIMGIELPTGDVTLNFNVESSTSSSFSGISLAPEAPILRLNSAMADTMFSEIILNDGSDVLTRISPDRFDDTPIGFDEDGSAIILDNNTDENSGESVSSDEGYTAPIDEEEENNAFISEDSEPTYFDELVSDDTEYLAGNVDSINDTVVTALFDEEFYDLMADGTQTDPNTGVVYTETDTSRNWNFTSLTAKTLTTSDDIFGLKVVNDTVKTVSSSKDIYLSIGKGGAISVPVPKDATNVELKISATKNDSRYFKVGSKNKQSIAAENTFTLDSADIVSNSVKVEVTSDSNGEAKITVIELKYTGSGTVTPDPDDGKDGSHTAVDETAGTESWDFTTNMPSTDKTVVAGKKLNSGVTVGDAGATLTSSGIKLAEGGTLSFPAQIITDKPKATITITSTANENITVNNEASQSDGTWVIEDVSNLPATASVEEGNNIVISASDEVTISAISVQYSEKPIIGPTTSVVSAYVYRCNQEVTITDQVDSSLTITQQQIGDSGLFSIAKTDGSASTVTTGNTMTNYTYKVDGLAQFEFSSRTNEASGHSITFKTPNNGNSAKLFVIGTKNSTGASITALKLHDITNKKVYNQDLGFNTANADTYTTVEFDSLSPNTDYTLDIGDIGTRLAGLILVNYTDEPTSSEIWVDDTTTPNPPVGDDNIINEDMVITKGSPYVKYLTVNGENGDNSNGWDIYKYNDSTSPGSIKFILGAEATVTVVKNGGTRAVYLSANECVESVANKIIGTETSGTGERKLPAGTYYIFGVGGRVTIASITIKMSANDGTYIAPESNNNTAEWGFIGAKDASLTDEQKINNGIVIVGNSSKLTAGGINLVSGDALKVPVDKEHGYTGGKITVTTESGTEYTLEVTDGKFEIDDTQVDDGFITVTSTGACNITGISIAYDKPVDTNYGTYDEGGLVWNFNNDDMPKNAGKATLKDGAALENNMTFKGSGDSYFKYDTSGSLHLAASDGVNIPITNNKVGVKVTVGLDSGSLKSGENEFVPATTNVSYSFTNKDAVGGAISITAGTDGADITTITVQYDSYDDTNFGTYKINSASTPKTRTWDFADDVPEIADVYLAAGANKLDGGITINAASADSYFGTDSKLHLNSGDKITVTLPKNITADSKFTITSTPDITPPAISANQETAEITVDSETEITKIELSYDSAEPEINTVHAYIYADKTSGNPAITYEDGLDSSIYTKQNIAGEGDVYKLFKNDGTVVSSMDTTSGSEYMGTSTVPGLGTVEFTRCSKDIKNSYVEITVPDEGNSAKLYVASIMKDSGKEYTYSLTDITGSPNYMYKSPGTVTSSFTTLTFDNLQPGHKYRLDLATNITYLHGLILVTSKEAYTEGSWEIDPNSPATPETAKVYVYLPYDKATEKNYAVASKQVANNEEYIQYANTTSTVLDIFTYSDTISDKKTDNPATVYVPGYGTVKTDVSTSKDVGDLTFTVPPSLSSAQSAFLYVTASSTGEGYRDIWLEDTSGEATYKIQAQRIAGGTDASKLRMLTFVHLKPGHSYKLTLDGRGKGESTGTMNVRLASAILVLSEEEFEVDSDTTNWHEERTGWDIPEVIVPKTPGDTSHIPFLWDYDPNYQADDNGTWNRNIDWDDDGWRTNSARNAAPYNYGWMHRKAGDTSGELDESANFSYPEENVDAVYGTEEYEIHWGGDWYVNENYKLKTKEEFKAIEKTGNTPEGFEHVDGVNQYPVKISGYEFDFENNSKMHFPTNFGGHSMGSPDFSNKGFGTYKTAYSAGYFEVIVPFEDNESDKVTVRATVRQFKANSLGGSEVTQSGITTGGAATDNSNYDVNHDEDKAKKENITGNTISKFGVLKYNSFMAKDATNINDKDITNATRENPLKRDITNNIKGQFLGDSASTNGHDWDASASKGDEIDIWSGFQLEAPNDNFVTAANLMMKFDAAAFAIDETDKAYNSSTNDFNDKELIGRTWEESIEDQGKAKGLSPEVNILWGVRNASDTVKIAGYDSHSSNDEFKSLKTDGEGAFDWYDKYSEAKAAGAITAAMAEMRDGYQINGIYFGFRVPVKVKDDASTGDVYATTNRLEAWSYAEGANVQPMKEFTWQSKGTYPAGKIYVKAKEVDNTTDKKDSKGNTFNANFHSSDDDNNVSYYDAAGTEPNVTVRHGYRITTNDDVEGSKISDKNIVITKYKDFASTEGLSAGHIGDRDADNKLIYPKYLQNRKDYATKGDDVKTAWTAGMGLLITDYKSQVQIDVNNPQNEDTDGMSNYDKAKGVDPVYRLSGIRTYTQSTQVLNTTKADTSKSYGNTNLTLTVDLTEAEGRSAENIKGNTGGTYFSTEGDKPVIKFVKEWNPDGTPAKYCDTTFEVPINGGKVTIKIPDDATTRSNDGKTITTAGAGKEFTVEATMKNDASADAATKYKNARIVTFEYKGVPHNVDLGEIILSTEVSTAAVQGTVVNAKTNITGAGDIRSFANYSRNQDNVKIGIRSNSDAANQKFVHIIDKPAEDTGYGEAQFKTTSSESLVSPELNQYVVFTLAHMNTSSDEEVVYAYDILGDILKKSPADTDAIGNVNIKAVKVFTSSMEDKGEEQKFPPYTVYFTDTSSETLKSAWRSPKTDGTPGLEPPASIPGGTEGDVDYTNGGSAEKSPDQGQLNEGENAVIEFKDGKGDNHTGICFAIGNSDTPAVAANRMLYVQLVCELVPSGTENLTDPTNIRRYNNTANFASVSGTGYNDVTDTASVTPVSRNISGVVWQDTNGNGIREQSENLREAATVALFRYDDTQKKYVPQTTDIYGNELGNTDDIEGDGVYVTESGTYSSSNTDVGTYNFDNLPAGDYVVAFKYDGVAMLSRHQPTGGRQPNTNDCVSKATFTSGIGTDIDITAMDGYQFFTKYNGTYPIALGNTEKVAAIGTHVQNETNWDLGFTLAGDPLPETGGVGTEGIKYAGLAIACGAALMLMWDYTKKQRTLKK